MNTYLLIASGLTIFLGLAHSVIGEVLIFRHWRRDGVSKATLGAKLPSRHRRILWSSWHLASVLGWGISAVLFKLAAAQAGSPLHDYIKCVLVFTMLAGGLLVLGGTRGKHPGWTVLLAIAALIWLA